MLLFIFHYYNVIFFSFIKQNLLSVWIWTYRLGCALNISSYLNGVDLHQEAWNLSWLPRFNVRSGGEIRVTASPCLV